LGVAEFARQRGVAYSTLQYWRHKLSKDESAPVVQLVPVRVADAPEIAEGDARELEARVGPFALRFRAGTSPRYVADLLRALAGS
jgi:transposase-like protein